MHIAGASWGSDRVKKFVLIKAWMQFGIQSRFIMTAILAGILTGDTTALVAYFPLFIAAKMVGNQLSGPIVARYKLRGTVTYVRGFSAAVAVILAYLFLNALSGNAISAGTGHLMMGLWALLYAITEVTNGISLPTERTILNDLLDPHASLTEAQRQTLIHQVQSQIQWVSEIMGILVPYLLTLWLSDHTNITRIKWALVIEPTNRIVIIFMFLALLTLPGESQTLLQGLRQEGLKGLVRQIFLAGLAAIHSFGRLSLSSMRHRVRGVVGASWQKLDEQPVLISLLAAAGAYLWFQQDLVRLASQWCSLPLVPSVLMALSGLVMALAGIGIFEVFFRAKARGNRCMLGMICQRPALLHPMIASIGFFMFTEILYGYIMNLFAGRVASQGIGSMFAMVSAANSLGNLLGIGIGRLQESRFAARSFAAPEERRRAASRSLRNWLIAGALGLLSLWPLSTHASLMVYESAFALFGMFQTIEWIKASSVFESVVQGFSKEQGVPYTAVIGAYNYALNAVLLVALIPLRNIVKPLPGLTPFSYLFLGLVVPVVTAIIISACKGYKHAVPGPSLMWQWLSPRRLLSML